MKFEQFEYTRPDIESVKADFEKLILNFNEAKNFEEVIEAINQINILRNDVDTAFTLVSIRHSVNTTDSFYETENEFVDENMPHIEALTSEYYKALVSSPYKNEIEKKWGPQIIRLAELSIKTFDPKIIPLLQEENKLSSQYRKLRTKSEIVFNNKNYNLPQIMPYLQSKDRDVRKNAQIAVTEFFKKYENDFDSIYDKMVKIRHQMALELGYENYVQLGYDKLNRTDYNAEMVESYRDQVKETIVPVVTQLKERQKKRLNLEELMYYDESLLFLSGNAMPKGDPEWLIDQGKKMYHDLSKETSKFFDFMIDHNLMDLVAKEGKAGGGYCTFIHNYKAPFIFSNFNGTSDDIDVLTHEAGHAFQMYSSKDFDLPEYGFPTLEACEIHSMGMELLTWPYMNTFFKEDVDKYKFGHLSGALTFIPYGVTVDEFQHFVYENPKATPDERKSKWHELEKKYLPHINYGDNDFLEKGTYWFRQGHIYMNPFYYIDYTLAQVCAFELWAMAQENREEAWKNYMALCQAGGSIPFVELIKLGNLHNPFEKNSLNAIIPKIENWLNQIDDLNM